MRDCISDLLYTQGHSAPVLTLAFTLDGRHLLSAGRTVRLWDIEGHLQVGPNLTLPATVNAIGLSPDGNTLATAAEDGTVKLWQLKLS